MRSKLFQISANVGNQISRFQFVDLLQNKKRIYLIATQVINGIIGIVSGKLIAQFILPEQFGLYNLQFAASTFFLSLLVGPTIVFIKSSYHNLFHKFGSKPFLVILGVMTTFLVVILLIIYTLFSHDLKFINYYYGLIILLIPLNVINSLATDQFNILDKINLYSSSSVIKSVVGIIFLIASINLFPNPIYGCLILWGIQLGISLVSLYYFISKYQTYKSANYFSYRDLIKKHFVFTIPLMYLAFWTWINNYLDRYIIDYYMTLKDVGIYNANYALGSKFFLLLSPIFMVILSPKIYKNVSISLRKDEIKKIATKYLLIGILILAILFFNTDFIGLLFLNKTYEAGFYIIYWLALVYFILTLTYLFETIFYAEHKTKVILVSNIVSAGLNIIFNLVLIPVYGLAGAVISMLISTVFRFLFVYRKFSKLC